MNRRDDQRLNRRLREGDPAEEQSALEIAAMRRRILDSARRSPAPLVRWPRLALVGALLVLCAVVLAVPGWLAEPAGQRPAGLVESGVAPVARAARQVQFQTPGGTRVIWVVASNLDL